MEVASNELIYEQELGQGSFGVVYKGYGLSLLVFVTSV